MFVRVVRVLQFLKEVVNPAIEFKLTAILIGFLHKNLFLLAGQVKAGVKGFAEVLLVKGVKFVKTIECVTAATELGKNHA